MRTSLRFLVALFIFLNARSSFSQAVAPDVVGSTGDFYANAGGQVQWTVGEVMVETYQSGNNYVTQGFHQPNYGVLIGMPNASLLDLSIFPNPATDNISLKFGTIGGNYSLYIYDITGNTLRAEQFTAGAGGLHTLSVKDFANGVYFLSLREENGFSAIYKIVVSK